MFVLFLNSRQFIQQNLANRTDALSIDCISDLLVKRKNTVFMYFTLISSPTLHIKMVMNGKILYHDKYHSLAMSES